MPANIFPSRDREQRRGTGHLLLIAAAIAFVCHNTTAWGEDAAKPPAFFGIRVVDEQSGRGVPLVELRTVSEAAYVTDSAGWAAVAEPDLAGKDVYFHLRSPGYDIPADGFGFRGRRLKVVPGESAEIKLRRTTVAERLYRITGQGVYRDTELLGFDLPVDVPQRGLGVTGQDSVQAVPYRGRVFWLWGDTNLSYYPLGNFQVTAATSPLPGSETLTPERGVALEYFRDAKDNRRVRKMMPLDEPGAVWLFGLVNVKGPEGRETLVAHYSRQKQLGNVLEHGLAQFDGEAGVYRRIKQLPLAESWRFPRGNAVKTFVDDDAYVYFCQPFANVRVRADWESITNAKECEALAWSDEAKEYQWQRDTPPTTQREECKLIADGKLPQAAARYQLRDAADDQKIVIHRASINWNPFRQRWIMIGNQEGNAKSPSYLGEVYFAEAKAIDGPWTTAVKIATHPKYSFYNPRHHAFMDEDGGRVIYFEGTYTRMFSATKVPTPRYDYNQLMYRLDLRNKRLTPARD